MRGSLALIRSVALAALVLFVPACSGGAADPGQLTPTTVEPASTTSKAPTSAPMPYPEGESLHDIVIDGVSRRFLVYVPVGVAKPHAVVFVLHGGGGEGLNIATVGEHPLAVFRTVADRKGFIVVYPEGLPADDRQGRVGWSDCRGDNLVASGADDIGFLTALVKSVGVTYELPAANLFMAGSSNGAQMTQAFAFHHPELLGAVASSAGSLPALPLPGPCANGPVLPIPILLTHGTRDTQMPYDGGCVANVGGACNRGRVLSGEVTRDRWLTINGLSDATPVETTVELDESDGGAAHRFTYTGPTPVEWWRLDGAGHAAPSRTVRVEPNRVTGTQNGDIEFAEVAWAFFEQRLPLG
jgi:polyhydroxybutyrate depolymerase